MRKVLLCAVMSLLAQSSRSAEPDWAFVWVSSAPGAFEVNKGKSIIERHGKSVLIHMIGDDGVLRDFRGVIHGERLEGKVTIKGSDYFQGTPMSGTYRKKTWSGVANSSGRESIVISDGWNVVAFTHEL